MRAPLSLRKLFANDLFKVLGRCLPFSSRSFPVSFSSAYAYHVQYRHQDRVRFDVFHGLQSPFNLLLQLCTFWLSGIQKAMIILSRAIHQIPIKSGRFFL